MWWGNVDSEYVSGGFVSCRSCAVIGCRVIFFECICPGPKTVSQTRTDKVNEERVRVISKKLLQAININGSHDSKKMRVF